MFRGNIDRHYTDVAQISRLVDFKTPTKETRKRTEVIYEGLPCRLSQKELATNGQTDTRNEVRYETKLFISAEYDICQGDTIMVKRGSTIRTYTAGEPFPYSTHQEVSLERKANA